MQNYKKWLSATVALSVLVLGAMNLTSVGSRSSGHVPYDRLLSKHFKRIAALEAEIGSYSHYRYFSERAERVIGDHNPRPSKVRGDRNLRNMRRDLERAMIGYEMRHNPDAVAGMHAAFECHIRNMNINSRLDQRCVKAYKTFKAKAERSADQAHMQVARAQSVPVIDTFMAPAAKGSESKIEAVDFTAPQKKVEMPPQQQQKIEFVPITPIAPKNMTTLPDLKVEISKDVIATPVAPALNMKNIEAPKVEAPKVEEIRPISPIAPVSAPKIPTMPSAIEMQPIPEATIEVEKPFNPLDYVHPRLRGIQSSAPSKASEAVTAKIQKFNSSTPSLPSPVKAPSVSKSAAYVPGKVSQVPVKSMFKMPTKNAQKTLSESFGIKRLSQNKLQTTSLFAPLNMSTSKIDMSMFEENAQIKPHPRFLQEQLKSSPEATAATSMDAPNVERYVVPFTRGGTVLSKSAQIEIQNIGHKIQNEKFSSIRFVGHADKGGPKDLNRSVSFERAANVHDALENIIKYVDIKKTSIDGLGDVQPIRAFRPEDDRNRRVVVELIR